MLILGLCALPLRGRSAQVAVKVMPKQRGKLSKERTLQKLVKEVGILHSLQVRRLRRRVL